jgi:hypothetical protein
VAISYFCSGFQDCPNNTLYTKTDTAREIQGIKWLSGQIYNVMKAITKQQKFKVDILDVWHTTPWIFTLKFLSPINHWHLKIFMKEENVHSFKYCKHKKFVNLSPQSWRINRNLDNSLRNHSHILALTMTILR